MLIGRSLRGPAVAGRAFIASDRADGLFPSGFNPCHLRAGSAARCACGTPGGMLRNPPPLGIPWPRAIQPRHGVAVASVTYHATPAFGALARIAQRATASVRAFRPWFANVLQFFFLPMHRAVSHPRIRRPHSPSMFVWKKPRQADEAPACFGPSGSCLLPTRKRERRCAPAAGHSVRGNGFGDVKPKQAR